MSNADFSQQQKNTSPGGFDAGSYREAKAEEPEAKLTPLQKNLAKLENALPGALGKQATAAVLCLVIVLVSAVGFGGGKLRAKYGEAKQWYSVGVEADAGYNLKEELWRRANAATNILTSAGNMLEPSDAKLLAAAQALDNFQWALEAYEDGKGTLHAVWEYNDALTEPFEELYDVLQSNGGAESSRMEAVYGEYSKLDNAQVVMKNLSYNEVVADYQDETGGFPAVILKVLFGVKEVEQFA